MEVVAAEVVLLHVHHPAQALPHQLHKNHRHHLDTEKGNTGDLEM